MSSLAKVTVVINIALAVVLVGIVAHLRTQLTAQQADLGSLRNENQRLTTKLTDAKVNIVQQSTAIDELEKEWRRLRSNLSRLGAEKKALEKQAVEAMEHAKAAQPAGHRVELRTEELTKELADLHKQHEGAVAILERLEREYSHIHLTVTRKPPHIESRVVGVKDNVVVLGVGQDDKVARGFQFTVSRGDKFVGVVKVTRVTADLSGCEILFTYDNQEIQVGDDAETKKF